MIAIVAAACGRSDLGLLVGDGGLPDVTEEGDVTQPDGPTCNASTCPKGCCDAAGQCENGAAINSCGTGGVACQNCQAEGFQFCYEPTQACGNAVNNCGPGNCNGCCVSGVCLAGSDPTECGLGGVVCTNCQSQGETCSAGKCSTATNCAPGNCGGCCQGNTCLPGTAPTECGTQGLPCDDCTRNGMSCNQFGQCTTGQSCTPQNCPNGCCNGTACQPGTSSLACGTGGNKCANCASIGDNCQNQQCTGTVTCNAANCGFGCCEGNTCVPGTSSAACGFGGQPCESCQSFGETCQGQTCQAQTQCNAQNCGFGCCEGNTCVPGDSSNACGFGGQPCQNCQAFGEACQGQTCQGQTQCNAQNCGFGCCEGNLCTSGTSSGACGFGGSPCQNCQAFGEMCQGQVCSVVGTCNAQTCPGGCCLGNACIPGTVDNACGFGGQACQNCQSFGDVCQGQICVAAGGCNANNCFGCCQGNLCVPGTMDTACGFSGQACQDCQVHNETCQGQTCQSACNPGNCQGCCDTNQMCQPGFLNNECGGFGAVCVNCTALNPPSTCNGGVSPPQCASQQMTCPSPYPGCAAPPEQIPSPVTACSTTDLQNAAAACAGGAQTVSCQNFFNFEFSQNPACGSCLQPFDYDFADQQGLFECVAPFVPTSCNQSDACDFDCTTQSCGSCQDQTSYDTCRTNVGTGQCAMYQQAATKCEQTGYMGGGSFCNPAGYPNFGAWLQGVGAHYCDMGPIFDGGFPD